MNSCAPIRRHSCTRDEPACDAALEPYACSFILPEGMRLHMCWNVLWMMVQALDSKCENPCTDVPFFLGAVCFDFPRALTFTGYLYGMAAR